MNKPRLEKMLFAELVKKQRRHPHLVIGKNYHFARMRKYRNGYFHIHSRKQSLTIKANFSHFAHCAIYELQSMQDITNPLKQLFEGVEDCRQMLFAEFPELLADNDYLFDENKEAIML